MLQLDKAKTLYKVTKMSLSPPPSREQNMEPVKLDLLPTLYVFTVSQNLTCTFFIIFITNRIRNK